MPRDLCGYAGLAAALLARAVRDARANGAYRYEAWAFLHSNGCAVLVTNLLEAEGLECELSVEEVIERVGER